jgi:uncharacterized protein
MRTLIVDGYNVIRSTPPYRHIAEQDLDSARVALVSDVAAFAHGEFKATIVFDGHNNPHSDGLAHSISKVTIVFSRFCVDADSVIESLSRTAREAGEDVLVVTSDAEMQWAVLGGGVVRMSADEFAGEIKSEDAGWREHAPSGSSKGRLEDRIDELTRERLARWARGEA